MFEVGLEGWVGACPAAYFRSGYHYPGKVPHGDYVVQACTMERRYNSGREVMPHAVHMRIFVLWDGFDARGGRGSMRFEGMNAWLPAFEFCSSVLEGHWKSQWGFSLLTVPVAQCFVIWERFGAARAALACVGAVVNERIVGISWVIKPVL